MGGGVEAARIAHGTGRPTREKFLLTGFRPGDRSRVSEAFAVRTDCNRSAQVAFVLMARSLALKSANFEGGAVGLIASPISLGCSRPPTPSR